MNNDSDPLDAMMQADAQAAPDKLDFLRKKVVEKRDLDQEIIDLEERIKNKKEDRKRMEHETLPALFMEAGVQSLGLDAQGNQPACTYELKDYYHASISAEWDEARREDAFELLEKLKYGDLIKNVIQIQFGMGETKLFNKVHAALTKLKVPFSVTRAVPWNSLTSMIKERYQDDKPLDDTQKRILGASVGFVVKMKAPKRPKKGD